MYEVAGKAYVKVHRSGGETIVAVCDEELLGRELREGKLRIHISREFYGGVLVDVDEVYAYIRNATMANVFGDEAVNALAKRYPALMDAAVRLGGVLHVQIFNSKRW